MDRLHFKLLISFFLWWTLPSCNNIAVLGEDEIAKIRYESFGCFGETKTTLTFGRKNGLTTVKVQTDGSNSVTRVAEIQPETLNSVIAAVRNLKKGGGCTSSIKYTVQTKSEGFVREDEGCQDTGFSNLLQEIFENAN